MDDPNLVEKVELNHSCFEKLLLLEWRNGKTCCPACFMEYGRVEIFFKNGLSVHYRSLHRRSDFRDESTVKQGIKLLQDLVASETFNNLEKLSDMRRANVSIFCVLFINKLFFFPTPNFVKNYVSLCIKNLL